MRTGERPHGRGSAVRRAIAAVALVSLFPAGAGAQSGKGAYLGSWSATAAIGYAIPNTDEYDNAFSWRLAAGYSPLPQFEIDLELGRFLSGVSQPEANGLPTHTIASGELDVMPVCLTAQYRTPLPGLLSTLTLLAGVGYYFIDYTMADEPRAVFAAGGEPGLPDQTVDDAWGFHAGAGLEYALTERFSLTAEGRYLFLSPQASGTAGSGRTIDGTLDLNTWIFTGGVKVAF
jgi:opacity protein-like surface antigen